MTTKKTPEVENTNAAEQTPAPEASTEASQASEPAATTETAPTPEATTETAPVEAAPVEAAPVEARMISVVVTGSIKGKASVPAGSKLSDAITAIRKTANPSMYAFKNGNVAVAADRVLNDNIEVSSVEKTSRG